MALPDAWALPEPDWVPMAPGVRFKLRIPSGADRMAVTAEVASVLRRVYDGRAGMEDLGLDEDPGFDEVLSLDRIQGLAGVLSACLYAKRCLVEWDGMVHPRTGEALDHADADNVRAALIHGAPPYGQPLLSPFLAWVERPQRLASAEAVRLRDLAEDHWSGGAERCAACKSEAEACAKGEATEGAICPKLSNAPATPEGAAVWKIAAGTSGLWARAGMGGRVTGLDYRAALLAFEELMAGDRPADIGTAFGLFQAVEAGRLQAEAKAAEEARS